MSEMTVKKAMVTVPAREEEQIAAVVCDLCGTEQGGAYWSDFDGVNWAPEAYGVERVAVQYGSGSHYPEGGFGKTVGVHMCPTCFTDRLVPWLESQGAEMSEKVWDY
jgi:hypothetical protein